MSTRSGAAIQVTPAAAREIHVTARAIPPLAGAIRILTACLVAINAGATYADQSAQPPVIVSEGERYGWRVITLDNSLIRLSVTPHLGGRVLELKLIDTDQSVANVRMDNIHRQPDDPNWPGADYGGFTDAATSGWPGPFWNQSYRHRIERNDASGSVTLVMQGQVESQTIERRMTLTPGSTAVRFQMRQTNRLDQPQQMTLRLHAEWAAGDKADNHDRIAMVSKKHGREQMPYIVGAEYQRFRWIDLVEPWVAIYDTQESTGLVRRFELPRDNKAHANDSADPDDDRASRNQMPLQPKLFFWAGYNESPQLLGDRGAFFALDWFAQQATVKPGESLRAIEHMMLFAGLPRVGFVQGQTFGCVTTDRTRYGRGGTIHVKASLASAQHRRASRVVVRVLAEDRLLHEMKAKVPASSPGQAGHAQLAWTLPSSSSQRHNSTAHARTNSDAMDQSHDTTARDKHGDPSSDGPLTVHATFFNGDQRLGDDHLVIHIVDQLVSRARRAMAQLQEQHEKVTSLLAQRPALQKRLDVQTEMRVLALRQEQAHAAYEQGEYEQVMAITERGRAEAADLIQRAGELIH